MFLTMWNSVLSYTSRIIISVKISLFFKEITSTTEFPDSNFLLHTISVGDKCDFQVANSLLATVNFEPCNYSLKIMVINDMIT